MLKFAKLGNVKSPLRSSASAAGIDFYTPEFDEEFIKSFNLRNTNPRSMAFFDSKANVISVRPHGQVSIPLRVKVDFSDEPFSELAFNDKSGVSWDKRLRVIGGIIDQDYQGELILNLFNYTDYPTYIEQNIKIIQGIIRPVIKADVVEVNISEIHQVKTERGEGGFGSTGK